VTLEHRQKHIVILICVGIIAGTFVAYEPIRRNGFVTYDDGHYIYDNPQITAGISWQSLGQAFTKPHFFMWHPLTTISHMLDCQFFGLNPLGHHFVSVLIHIANTLLLFLILRNVTGTIWASAFVAAVFALHPVHVESVAWAAERKTVLSGLFWLLTMAAYFSYVKQPRLSRYLLLLLIFGLCIMTKPVVVTLPFALLLLDYWPLDRVRWGQPAKTKSNQKYAGWLIAEKIPLLAMSAILSVTTFIASKSGGVVQTLERAPLAYRIANMFLSYIRYIGKMIWPSKLAVFYTHPQLNILNPLVVTCIILFILLTVLSIDVCRRRKYIVFGWLWYVGTLVPVIGLIQAGTQAMANRYMYIPMLGLLIGITWAVRDFIIKRPRFRIAAAVICLIALPGMLILTRMQVRHWQDNTTLFEYTLRITENNILAENNCGMILLEAGHVNEAIEHFNNVRRINKNHVNAYVNLGMAYSQLGQYGLAIQNWKKALELKPNSAEALNNMAYVLAAVDNPSIHDANKAIELAQHACELTEYKEPVMLDTLAIAYSAAGKFDDAVIRAKQAIDAAKAKRQEEMTLEIEGRLELYRKGISYIQK
jgi:protein O-mannosyl-transferase